MVDKSELGSVDQYANILCSTVIHYEHSFSALCSLAVLPDIELQCTCFLLASNHCLLLVID